MTLGIGARACVGVGPVAVFWEGVECEHPKKSKVVTRFLNSAPHGLRPVLANVGVYHLHLGQKALVSQLRQPRLAFPMRSVQARILLQPAVPSDSLEDAHARL